MAPTGKRPLPPSGRTIGAPEHAAESVKSKASKGRLVMLTKGLCGSCTKRTIATRARHAACSGIVAQKSLQAAERCVPFLGDPCQVFAGFLDALWAELPNALAALLRVVHQAGVGQRSQVFGDGLAGDVAVFTQAHDRQWPFIAQAGDELESRFVAQRGEQRCGFTEFEGASYELWT